MRFFVAPNRPGLLAMDAVRTSDSDAAPGLLLARDVIFSIRFRNQELVPCLFRVPRGSREGVGLVRVATTSVTSKS